MGEGWGEGEYNAISTAYIPLPFVPSRQGRGNPNLLRNHFHGLQLFVNTGFPLEFTPWIPAFAGMTNGAGMTRVR